MRAGSQKNIECDPEGSIATINHLAAENVFGEKITIDDVISILAANGILSNIDTMAIEIAVEHSNLTGDPIEDLVVAKAKVKNEIIFADNDTISTSDLMKEIDSARKAYTAYNSTDEEVEADFQARFIKKNSLICQVIFADHENIYGDKIKRQNIPVVLKPGENVDITESANSVLFHANTDGYLVIDENMRLHIVSPFQYSSDRMRLSLTLMPMKSTTDYQALLNYYAREHQNLIIPELGCMDLYSVMEHLKLLEAENNIVEHLVVSKGISPIPSQNATIKIYADTEKPKMQEDLSISDYMKMAQYTMVSQGELLAKITPAIDGVPGKDVYGNIINTHKGKNRDISVGENIRYEEINGTVSLFAEKEGCLIYNNYRISVSDVLHINGDVGPNTGNIYKGSSIIINGNILSGFTVECKNDLIVKGSIENNVTVRCGNLIVNKGVFCKKGLLYVKENADIGYVQDANIRVSGDLTIQRYIHGSRISVRGDLLVLGRGVTSKQRGAIIGSRISALGNAELHSVGNITEETIISCGVDQEINSQITNSETVISHLQSEVVAKQKSVNLDFNNANTIDMINHLPESQKEYIIKTLKEIKKILNTIDTYKEKIEALKEKAFAEDLDAITITVKSFIIPKTTLVIGRSTMTISQKHDATKARLDKDKIKLYPNY